METEHICVLIPSYHNEKTIVGVLHRVMMYTDNVIVVLDGEPQKACQVIADAGLKPYILSYKKNQGKGHALKEGFKEAIRRGYEYAITLDSDGQHYPEDIPLSSLTLFLPIEALSLLVFEILAMRICRVEILLPISSQTSGFISRPVTPSKTPSVVSVCILFPCSMPVGSSPLAMNRSWNCSSIRLGKALSLSQYPFGFIIPLKEKGSVTFAHSKISCVSPY